MKKYIIGAFLLLLVSTLTMAQSGYKVGDIADDFSLKGTDDKMHSMSDYKNAKGFIIIFTCNHCPYSVAYEDRIIALHQKYEAQGYHVIAINPNDPSVYASDGFKQMKVRAKEKGFTFPYLVDKDQHVFPKYGATKTPHVFLLDSQRKVQYIGAIDNAVTQSNVTVKYLENAVEALKKGNTPSPATTKAIGCSIKTK